MYTTEAYQLDSGRKNNGKTIMIGNYIIIV